MGAGGPGAKARAPRLLLLVAAALGADAHAEAPDALAPFRPLAGTWRCDGTFARSGAKVSATLAVAIDEATHSISLRHDDLPPNGYHAVELWGAAEDGGFRATIVDASSGVRWLTSTGWRDGALEWERRENGDPKEIFRYSRVGGGGFEIEWFVVAAPARRVLGDSVACRRA